MPSGLDTLAPCEDRLRWDAVTRRDEAADAAFVYAVRTTGVYCRPTCPARLPHRENVVFYATSAEAERAGFRACKRCKPDGLSQTERHAAAVTTACRLIATAEATPKLSILANAVAMSPAHFHRLFLAMTGLTPKAYADAKRAARFGREFDDKQSVTTALHAAGYGAASRFYETAEARLGMTPTAYRAAGAGTEIRFAVGACSLGAILVAATMKGICAILIGDDPAVLIRDLEDRFGQATLVGDDSTFERTVAHVIAFVEAPRQGLDLPLDIRGTAFQERVWRALQAIPVGMTASYSEVALALGQPTAVRAVARACAANAIAVAIPCHRVVRIDGALSGYRWGVERKRALLARETPNSTASRKPHTVVSSCSGNRDIGPVSLRGRRRSSFALSRWRT